MQIKITVHLVVSIFKSPTGEPLGARITVGGSVQVVQPFQRTARMFAEHEAHTDRTTQRPCRESEAPCTDVPSALFVITETGDRPVPRLANGPADHTQSYN